MKMVMVVYNEAVESEVMEVLEHCGLKNYTKITGVYGRGTTSGTHLGNDIWPGQNTLLYIACDEKQAKQLLTCTRELKKQVGKEGIKAFLLPLEEIT
ncbi:MAG: PG0541 family transporter-associated protein [Candidatus Omnitrophota bacterium]